MARVFLNNVKTKLTATLTAGATSCTVTAGDGALFAGATGGNTIRATLAKVSGYKEIAWEIIEITARSTDTLTITRAQEGTTAIEFAVGDTLDVRWTAGSSGEAIIGSSTQVYAVAIPTASTHAVPQSQMVDGWVPSLGAWTCTTAGVAGSLNANGTLNVTPVAAIFTVAGDMTATYFRGVRIKFTQTTVKYGYVNSSSYSAGTGLTTVTLIANAGYQMGLSSGVAITLPSFSFGAPAGFPEKLAYIGASVPASGAFTTITSTLAFTMFGRTCMVIGSVAMTNVGTGVGSLTVTAPFAASTNNNVGSGREVNATGVQLSVWYNGNINVGKYDATGAVFTGWSDLFAFTYQ